MLIHNYGEVLLCRDITFEDNKVDLEYSHPGIVLLPTTDKNDEVYCLYMTSNEKRAKREQEKYVKNNAKAVKESFINVQQIVKRSNIKDEPKTQLNDEQFKEILESFYNYQISLNPLKKEFLEIKPQIETLLNILNFNKEFEINDYVLNREQLDRLSSIPEKDKQRFIYAISILRSKNPENKKVRGKNFVNEKYKEYFKKLIKTYDEISVIDFNNLNFEDSNNPLRDIYFNIRNNNYLLNINKLFDDVATIFELQDENVEKGKKIKEFVKYEQQLEVRRAVKIEVKHKKKLNKKIKKAKCKTNKKYKNMLKRDKKKYGDFDIDFFDYK